MCLRSVHKCHACQQAQLTCAWWLYIDACLVLVTATRCQLHRDCNACDTQYRSRNTALEADNARLRAENARLEEYSRNVVALSNAVRGCPHTNTHHHCLHLFSVGVGLHAETQ